VVALVCRFFCAVIYLIRTQYHDTQEDRAAFASKPTQYRRRLQSLSDWGCRDVRANAKILDEKLGAHMSIRPDNWEERLANARARQKPADPEGPAQPDARKKAAKFYQSKIGEMPEPVPEKPEPDPDSDSGALVSVDDVLQTANLNDRMEMARLRHGQILALRALKNGANGQSETVVGLKDTTGAAKVNGTSNLTAKKSRSAPEKIAAPVAVAVQPVADRKKRRAGVVMAFAAVVALIAAAGFSGTGRAFLDGLIGGGTTIQAALELPEPSAGVTADSTLPQAAPVTVAPQSVEPEPALLAGQLSQFGSQPPIPEIDPDDALSAFATEFVAPGAVRVLHVALGTPTPEVAPNGALGDPVPVYATVAKPTATLPAEQLPVSGANAVPIGPAPSVLGNIELLSATGILAEPSVDVGTPARISTISSAADVEQLELIASLNDLSPRALQPVIASRVQVILAPGFDISAGDPGISNGTAVPDQFMVPLPLAAAPGPLVPPIEQQVFALLSDAPSPSPSPIPVSAGARFQFSNLVVHAPAGLADRDVDLIVTAFRDAGFAIGPPQKVGFNISKTNVRYFHPGDRDGAGALADIVGGVARDFTDFRPKPPAGTIEVWLAGRSGTTTRRPTRGGESPAMLQLRNRLVESLRQWDR